MKNSSIENRFCMSLVAFAVIVRLLLATGAAAAVDEAFGRAPQAQAPEPDILTLEILAAPEPIVPPEPEPQPAAAAAVINTAIVIARRFITDFFFILFPLFPF